MSWRTVVISQNAKLDYQIGYLVVRGKETVKIHLDEIGILIVENTSVSLTAYLLSELTKKKIKIIFCDEKRNPSSELVSYYGSHETSAKIKKQMSWTKQSKEEIWTAIVTEKINKQAELLQCLNKPEAGLLSNYIEEMEMGEFENPVNYDMVQTGFESSRTHSLFENPVNYDSSQSYQCIMSFCLILLHCSVYKMSIIKCRKVLTFRRGM